MRDEVIAAIIAYDLVKDPALLIPDPRDSTTLEQLKDRVKQQLPKYATAYDVALEVVRAARAAPASGR
jgi:hypothetical protein